MVLVKKLTFCYPFVLYKIYRKKVFADVLVRKQAFLDNTTTDFKKRAIGILRKGIIVHEFGETVKVFSSVVFIKNRSLKSVC